MRLNKTRVHQLSASIVDRLTAGGTIRIEGPPDPVVQHVASAIVHELQAEDRLNAEVRETLKKFEREFSEGRADYQKMFSMVKQKLIKDRGIIL